MLLSVLLGSVLNPHIPWYFKFLGSLVWGLLSALQLDSAGLYVSYTRRRLGIGIWNTLSLYFTAPKGSSLKHTIWSHLPTVLLIDVIIWARNIFRSSSTFPCQTAQAAYRGEEHVPSSARIWYPSFAEGLKCKYKGRTHIFNSFHFG